MCEDSDQPAHLHSLNRTICSESSFFSPFSIAITSLGEERANLSAFRTSVRFVLVWICRFPLPLGVWEGLRFVIVALPGLFSYLFFFFNASILESQGWKVHSCAQRNLKSDCAFAQSDLRFRWAHMSKGTFSHIAAKIILHYRSNTPLVVRKLFSIGYLSYTLFPFLRVAYTYDFKE